MIGFDYGTSNCAVAVMENSQPKLVQLGEHGNYIPSTLYAPAREMIVNWLHQHLPEEQQNKFQLDRKSALNKGQVCLNELREDAIESEIFFGKKALQSYLEAPDEGYYIKSPKSFLGFSGLTTQQIQLFEDIVATMMANVKQLTEQKLQRQITQTVIGKPVNFKGINGDKSNAQALTILSNAAKRVGFKDVEFLFEPVAAGYEFEASLQTEKRVLVVDIGGGTSDCSMMLMSPKLSLMTDRSSHLLSHSGERIGGNDFDINLALKGIMPELGLTSLLKNGKPMPTQCYRNAVSINDIVAQTHFYSAQNKRFIMEMMRDTRQPEKLQRLLLLQQERMTYQLVNSAEQAKIKLSASTTQSIDLHYLEDNLNCIIDLPLLKDANQHLLRNIIKLMQQAVDSAQCQPDIIFITGGTAKIKVLQDIIQAQYPQAQLVIGDHFGSVTSGLARWAERIYR
ncbi:chaperone [Psychromonas sp. CNPT3]|uniref:molecular chaperone n=1 Tax=Psychromonas sp. CNPT3 TaxID=314282 RepID=UPI00006E424E|nr:molecular chaperone [Psychromonas sp. CNPT3]AGH81097.1 chaperone [Psychromonas sp. CNPT3]